MIRCTIFLAAAFCAQTSLARADTVWAQFQCARATPYCTMVGSARVALGRYMPEQYFRSRQECEQTASSYGRLPVDEEGRVWVGREMWYECLSKQTWGR